MFAGFPLSRTLGLPAYTDEIGNWEAEGIATLVVEALFVPAYLLHLPRVGLPVLGHRTRRGRHGSAAAGQRSTPMPRQAQAREVKTSTSAPVRHRGSTQLMSRATRTDVGTRVSRWPKPGRTHQRGHL
jgi:hypothetical protein